MRYALVLLAAVALSAPTAAAAADGGASAPAGDGGAPAPSGTGGTEYRAPLKPPTTARALRPVATIFHVTARANVGDAIHFAYRVNASAETVRVRVALVRVGERTPAFNIDLGQQPTGKRVVSRWLSTGAKAGNYLVRLHVVDPDGRRLARSASASGRASLALAAPPAPSTSPMPITPLPTTPTTPLGPAEGGPGVFPLQGSSWSFGNEDNRFGAKRSGHTHQGQDIIADSGTPIVAPRAGTITQREYQAAGAGYYLVLHDDALPRDYVFDHIKKDTYLVAKGDHVLPGQQLAQVGATGDAEGNHLHFEIWVGGWYEKGGAPIDPLPDLKRWAGR